MATGGADGRNEVGAQRRGRGHGDGLGEQRSDCAQRVDLVAAGLAPAEVHLEVGTFTIAQGVEDVGPGEAVQVVAHGVTPNWSLRRMSPSRMRVFAVPSGRSSRLATSVCV